MKSPFLSLFLSLVENVGGGRKSRLSSLPSSLPPFFPLPLLASPFLRVIMQMNTLTLRAVLEWVCVCDAGYVWKWELFWSVTCIWIVSEWVTWCSGLGFWEKESDDGQVNLSRDFQQRCLCWVWWGKVGRCAEKRCRFVGRVCMRIRKFTHRSWDSSFWGMW